MAKLTETQRNEIWRLWQDRKNNPISLRKIGERYGVSDVTAGAIIKKKREEAEKSEGGVAEVINDTELPEIEMVTETAAAIKEKKDKRLILTDICMCGVKAGISGWRTTSEENYHYQIKLRSGTWDELTKDEMVDVARDLLAAAEEIERLAAQAGR